MTEEDKILAEQIKTFGIARVLMRSVEALNDLSTCVCGGMTEDTYIEDIVRAIAEVNIAVRQVKNIWSIQDKAVATWEDILLDHTAREIEEMKKHDEER